MITFTRNSNEEIIWEKKGAVDVPAWQKWFISGGKRPYRDLLKYHYLLTSQRFIIKDFQNFSKDVSQNSGSFHYPNEYEIEIRFDEYYLFSVANVRFKRHENKIELWYKNKNAEFRKIIIGHLNLDEYEEFESIIVTKFHQPTLLVSKLESKAVWRFASKYIFLALFLAGTLYGFSIGVFLTTHTNSVYIYLIWVILGGFNLSVGLGFATKRARYAFIDPIRRKTAVNFFIIMWSLGLIFLAILLLFIRWLTA
jgi:F0F1-type ATP synthase assembly protein I